MKRVGLDGKRLQILLDKSVMMMLEFLLSLRRQMQFIVFEHQAKEKLQPKYPSMKDRKQERRISEISQSTSDIFA